MKKISARRSEQEWMDIILKCRQSGMSDRSWCREQGIAINTFYYHVKQLRKKACRIPAPHSDRTSTVQEIVQLDFSGMDTSGNFHPDSPVSHSRNHTAVVMDYRGIRIEITNTASGSAIYETLRALQKLC